MALPSERPLRVLLIEDNPGDARLIREMLRETRRQPCELETATRLESGLERMEAEPFDLILLDLSLPDSRGLQTFSRVQAQAASIPIVVLSGLADETVAMQAVQEGAQDYLVKGEVDGPVLLRSIHYAIERKRAEEEREQRIREQAARAAERAAVLGQITDGVVLADPSGRITYVNDAARRLLGRDWEGATIGDLAREHPLLTPGRQPYPPEDLPLARALWRNERVIKTDLLIQRPDGLELVVEGSATPVLAEDGTRLGAVLTLRDVTAERELERQKDEFLTNVSHDLRTPVAAIKASIGVVLANEPTGTPEPVHRLLVNIDLAADRMARLVEDLLELTRLQAGRIQFRPGCHDLRALAQRSAATIEPLARERGQRLELDLPSEPLPARVDAERLERALLNLLGNAQKYGDPGGEILLRLEQRPDDVLISVSDTGPGISEAEQQHIFDRFYRVQNDATERNQGSGLGLPIARAMVELHGGRIWVESTPGRGTTFWVSLPADGDLLEPMPARPVETRPPGDGKGYD